MEVNETAGIREYDTDKDSYCSFIGTSNFFRYVYTDAEISLHTTLVKYYFRLFGRQSSEQGRDEVTYFFVGDHFRILLGTMYVYFQEKSLWRFFLENWHT